MASEYCMSLTPVKAAELPPADKILAAAHVLLESTKSWKQGKTFHKVVRTYSRPKAAGESAAWHCRVSKHDPQDEFFGEMWEKLDTNKGDSGKAVQPADEVKKPTVIKQISPTQSIWTMRIPSIPPFDPRIFTVLRTTEFNTASPRSVINVSIPVDLSGDPELAKLEEKGVKGRYAAIEFLKELPDGMVEWRYATSFRMEGMTFQVFVEPTMPSNISQAPRFRKYLHSLRPSTEEQKKG